MNRAVQEILNWIGVYCSEGASAYYDYNKKTAFCWDGDEWVQKTEKARKNGVRDLQGWLADEMYNDVGLLQDIVGDKVYDYARGSAEKAITILKVLESGGHTALKTACSNMIKTWEDRK